MYRATSCIDLTHGRPALLIPIFRYKNQNEPYVQVMDEFLMVEAFAPYYASEEYETHSLEEQHAIDEGWRGLICFRAPDRRIVTCTVSELFNYVEENGDDLKEYALLQMQLLRLTSANFATQYEAWRQVSRTYLRPENQELWLESEISSYQRNDAIWRSITAPEEHERTQPEIILRSGDAVDVEELIKVLTMPVYYRASNWEPLWFLLLRKLPLDARTVGIAKSWLYHKYSSGEGFESARNVFCAVVDNSADLYWDEGFTDFCFELCSDGTLFSEESSVPFRIIRLVFMIIQKAFDGNVVQELIIKILDENPFPPHQLEFFIDQLTISARETPMSGKVGTKIWSTLMPRLEVYDLYPEVNSSLRSLRRLIPRSE